MKPLQTVRVLSPRQHDCGDAIGTVLETQGSSVVVLFASASEGNRFRVFSVEELESEDVVQDVSLVSLALDWDGTLIVRVA